MTYWTLRDRLVEVLELLLCHHPAPFRVLADPDWEPTADEVIPMLDTMPVPEPTWACAWTEGSPSPRLNGSASGTTKSRRSSVGWADGLTSCGASGTTGSPAGRSRPCWWSTGG